MRWNKVTWYSKLIALALFVALPFIGFWYGTQYGELVAALNAPGTSSAGATGGAGTGLTSPYYANVGAWQPDVRSDAGFSMAYPLDFMAEDTYSVAPTTNWYLGAQEPGVKRLAIPIPRAIDPQTNFIDATLTVGDSGNDLAVAHCTDRPADMGPNGSVATTTVNGIVFTVLTSSDAGAGNFYETTSYRTRHAGECFVVEYTIHSSQIMNYPPQYGLLPFDRAGIRAVLDRMVATFKFL